MKSFLDSIMSFTRCAYCESIPVYEDAPTLRELLKGGWTCPECGKEHSSVLAELASEEWADLLKR